MNTDVADLMDRVHEVEKQAIKFQETLASQESPPKPKGDGPTPAQLLAALRTAAADLSTAVTNYDTAAALLVAAEDAEATASANVETARDVYDAANLAYIASLLPPG
jgi:hypothetical protein